MRNFQRVPECRMSWKGEGQGESVDWWISGSVDWGSLSLSLSDLGGFRGRDRRWPAARMRRSRPGPGCSQLGSPPRVP